MANYADALLAKAQAKIQGNFGEPEKRVKTNGSFTPFARNTRFTLPEIEALRVAKDRPVEVNFLTRSKRTVTNARTHNHAGTQGDSAKVTLPWETYADVASTSIKLSENLIYTNAEVVANEIENMLKNIAIAVHADSLAFLDTNKTGVNDAIANGTFNGTNDVFEILAADKDFYFQYLESMLMQNYYQGNFDAIVDPKKYAQAVYLGNQGVGNATNFGYQLQNAMINQAVGLADANYANGIGYVIPEGTIGAVDWTEPKNRQGYGDIESFVGGFRTIRNPYLNNMVCNLHAYMTRADNSGNGGSTQDVVINWEISADVALVKAPINVADETTIFAGGQL